VGSAQGDARLLRTLHDADPALIFVFAVVVDVQAEAMAHPHTRYVTLDHAAAAPNISLIVFDVEDASYLAGAAAALTSTTGTIGFIGGVDNDVIWPFEAGYEAGARAVDADVEILTRYLSTPPNFEAGFQNPEGGAAAARQMFDAGADVVFTAAGSSGLGVFQTAVEMSASEGVHLWTIGTGPDQFTSVVDLPGSLGAAAWQEHILTSVVLQFGDVVYDALARQADGKFRAGPHHVGLAEGAIDVSYSGGFIDDIRPRIEALRRSILDGTIRVPCRPARMGVTQCA
jgi:basic membrane protein A